MRYKSPFEISNSQDYAPSTSRVFVDCEVKTITPNFRGLFATEDIPQGSVIASDGGLIVTAIDDVIGEKNYVALVGENLWLAPRDADALEPIFFINHSCNSNVSRIGGLIYIAKRDIECGEQMTVDYAPMISDYDDFKIKCCCNETHCRGFITSKDWLNPELSRQLWHEWLPYVQRKIRNRK